MKQFLMSWELTVYSECSWSIYQQIWMKVIFSGLWWLQYIIFICMQSVTVRWEAPPREGRNGIITGYKLRYRKRDRRGERRGDTVTTAGDRRLYTLVGLERRSVYQVRLWALNVNGTGPPTDWYTVETYENDLDESQVPDTPTALKGKEKVCTKQYVNLSRKHEVN